MTVSVMIYALRNRTEMETGSRADYVILTDTPPGSILTYLMQHMHGKVNGGVCRCIQSGPRPRSVMKFGRL